MLHVHRSHDVTALADALGSLLADPLPDPMQTEMVMVASPGMKRWLQGRIATERGVLANVAMPYPAGFLGGIVNDLLKVDAEELVDPWATEPLSWYVAGLLGAVVDEDEVFAPVRSYLRAGGDETPDVIDRRTLGFARQTAELYDRYALHRPDLLVAWAAGEDVDATGARLTTHAWQAALWRVVHKGQRIGSPPERFRSAVAALRGDEALSDEVPPRLSVFGISSLPRLHLELLAATAATREVHLFVPTSAPQLWALGVQRAAERQPALPGFGQDAGDDGDRLRSGLLVAAGGTTVDAAQVMNEAAAAAGVALDDRLMPVPAATPTTVLAAIQRSVVTDAAASGPVQEGDRSVVFHDCHGPLRQVEVLHDEVRRLLDADPTLEPRDVLVLTPDLATFGPILAAVFANRAYAASARGRGRADGTPPPVPVAVTGRAVGAGNGVAVALRRILGLAAGRVTAAGVLDLIRTTPVARHLRLTSSELDTLDRWVRETGVRWARDEADRVASGQPSRRDHTWAAGLDRLLVGVAMADERDRTHGGVVPFDDVEDQGDLDLLGRLLQVVDVVQEVAGWREARGTDGWRDALTAALDRLTGVADGDPWLTKRQRDDHRRDRQRVDAVVWQLGTLQQAALSLVDVRAVERWVDRELDRAGGGGGGAGTGAVTVADLAPMRAVPFRVVCLLGMDEGSFPRTDTRPGHDLIAVDRKPGDPDRRAEDRHMFVEALLAVRDTLLVTWTGRDERTGRARPPAIPVAELRDAVAGVVGEKGLDALTHAHPVLPISPRAFDGPVASYEADRLTAAEALRGLQGPAPAFLVGELPDDEAAVGDGDTIELNALVRTLRDPARALLDALRLRRGDRATAHEEAEPVELDALERSQVGRALLDAAGGGRSPDAVRGVLLRRGMTPAAALGRQAVLPVESDVAKLVRFAELAGETQRLRFEVEVAGRTLAGAVDVVLGDGEARVVDVAYVRPRADRTLGHWVTHLAATLALPDVAVTTVVGHRPSGGAGIGATVFQPTPIDEAQPQLAHAVELHGRARRSVVPLLPALSWTWAQQRAKVVAAAAKAGMDEEEAAGLSLPALLAASGRDPKVVKAVSGALAAARTDWSGGFMGFGAVEQESVRLVYRDVERVEDLVHTAPFEAEVRWVSAAVEAVAAGKKLAKEFVTAAEAAVVDAEQVHA